MRVLGLDAGIASLGWALIEIEESNRGELSQGTIIGAGTWMFDAPEEKTQAGAKLKSEQRRTFRGQRRVVRRRRQRMNEVRRILHSHGLLPSSDRDALKQPGLDPWRIRAEALDRLLGPVELAVALGHIARHRGFKSNSKGAKTNDPADDTSKMKRAVNETREKLARFGSAAKMLVEDESFVLRQTPTKNGASEIVRRFRNREGDYSRSLLRDDLAAEMRALFTAQARFQSAIATADLQTAFTKAAFFQRPLQDSEKLVGPCPFEVDEKRAPKRGYSFELFRFLSRLNHVTLRDGKQERTLTRDELALAAADFGAAAKVSFTALRKKLKLPETTVFVGVKADEESKLDVVARSGKAAEGTARLRSVIVDALGELAWGALLCSPEKLDKIAEVISFRSDIGRISEGLAQAGCNAPLVDALTAAASDGRFDPFTGAGHISSKAARNILSGLRQGMTYDKACCAADYDHTASRERGAFDVGGHGREALKRILQEERISRELVGSPTARKALIESIKQVKAIVERYGVPDRIHVELARDVGKSIEEREEITRGIEKRNRQKDKLRGLFEKEVGRPPQDGARGKEELLRFELWSEQMGRCLYTDDYISPSQLVATDDAVQVDHILPWSRFADDSYANKTLCMAKANQDKKGRTPYEWFKAEKTDTEWDAFIVRVEALADMKGFKKRNYKLRNAEEAAAKFRNRNLNDTRWACRLLAEALKQLYPKGEKDKDGKERRRVFSRPGALTDRLRRAWGLQWMKKSTKGDRIPDDRHHALDAIVIAATTESLLQRATREVQEIEDKGLHYDLVKNVTPPWPGFREQAVEAVEKVFVARAERRRARGKAHDATIRHIAVREGEQRVYERRKVAELKLADLDRVKDAERNARLIEKLRNWIEAGSPKDDPPLSPKGDPIFKVRLVTKSKVNIALDTGNPKRPGTVDRGEMARVDVFRKASKKGKYEYYLVPIYPHDIATMKTPPIRAVQAYKPEDEWPEMDSSYEFCWSLVPMTYLQVISSKGEIFEGYYRGMNRSVGAIQLSAHSNSSDVVQGIGARTLTEFKKFNVDRFGRKHEVERELRTWRGETWRGKAYI
ncbi:MULTISPECIES: type II CRISPR RNA-guided endonuclease Cas9 [Methylosinus]|uniref:CRISPR-associated endonuclease Cas9 n=1 Tax=Methylosinus trichosporium (strain ATCC 35070 / NCIMB 11131 / UNIQEM 75 / OB3b) TaxID=595536 RepID=A0A2D2CYM2_METT3|nr:MULTISPECIES: type II CRISPR RNA-guided endonuclease Cas9 [Methylosinus]ATQ67843.1 type II CRISPR RNA-guided endonuclease Cas9 [Methylosinus trichosporium OB3b]OBS51862.1 type II CRISPR RNA-guided endonuclease Cas9 [Methylosinus sp. 3S-1]